MNINLKEKNSDYTTQENTIKGAGSTNADKRGTKFGEDGEIWQVSTNECPKHARNVSNDCWRSWGKDDR